MLGGLLTMSTEEIDHLGVARRVLDGRMRLRTAAEVMGVTTRHARRLCRAYEAQGAEGLVLHDIQMSRETVRAWVKELRIQGISTMKGANGFLPRNPHDAHRPLVPTPRAHLAGTQS